MRVEVESESDYLRRICIRYIVDVKTVKPLVLRRDERDDARNCRLLTHTLL